MSKTTEHRPCSCHMDRFWLLKAQSFPAPCHMQLAIYLKVNFDKVAQEHQ